MLEDHFVVPARFRPFHLGHYHMLCHLLGLGPVTVVVAWSSRLNERAPLFSFEVRAAIRSSFNKKPDHLQVRLMPYFVDSDDHGYARQLEHCFLQGCRNVVVSANPLVLQAVRRYLQAETIDPLSLVPPLLRSLSATAIRRKIIAGDLSFVNDIPNGTASVLTTAGIIDRICHIDKIGLDIVLDRSFPVWVTTPSGLLTLQHPLRTFLDDYVTRRLGARRYYGMDTANATTADLKPGSLIPVGMKQRGSTYGYEFTVSGRPAI